MRRRRVSWRGPASVTCKAISSARPNLPSLSRRRRRPPTGHLSNSTKGLAAGEVLEPLLHGVELGLEIGDLFVAARGLRRLVVAVQRRSMVVLGIALLHPGSERAEQAKSLLEGREILAHLLLHRVECRGAEGVGESAAILLLLAGQRIEAEFEVARHEPLHAVAVEADEL